jgi:nucleoside-diphosphate-sugar epimerase
VPSNPLSILVTGGAGYIGSVLVPELLAAGHRVTVLDNFLFRQTSLNAVCHLPSFQLVRGDSRSDATMKPLLAKADAVIPLAALVGAPLCDRDPVGATSTNRDAIAMLVKLASPNQRLVLPNTNSGYGVGEAGKFCTEETPLRPISLYGRDKCAAEEMVRGAGGVTFRLATVFGMAPRMRLDLLVNDFVYRAVTDRTVVVFEGHFKRNYIHVRDVARAFMMALDRFDEMCGQVYNVGLSDANLSKLELCARIQKVIPGFTVFEGKQGEDPDKRDYIVSNEKIEALGFKPAFGLDAGIVELVKGYTMLRNNSYANV